jgi:hypothetical protein
MATALTPTARPVALRKGTTVRVVYWHRLSDAVGLLVRIG